MTAAVAIGLCAAVGFCLFGARVGRRLPPATATLMLVLLSVCVAAATVGVLATVAFTAVAQVPVLAAVGDWSAPVLRATDPVPVWIAVGCGVLLVPAGVLLIRAVGLRVRAVAGWYRMCRGMEHASRLIVVDDDRPEAFAAPVGRGRIVVSTGMLRALPDDERRALIAHERSHVSRGHPWLLMAADLAAAVNPLLSGATREAHYAAERWADEDAAATVGDRRLVARALARAALHTLDHGGGRTALAAATGHVGDRVRALMGAKPRFRLLPAIVLVALAAAAVGGAVTVLDHADDFLDHASVASWDPLGLD